MKNLFQTLVLFWRVRRKEADPGSPSSARARPAPRPDPLRNDPANAAAADKAMAGTARRGYTEIAKAKLKKS